MKDLDALLNSGNPWAVQKGKLLSELKEQYDNGMLSADEFKELLQDISNTDAMTKDANAIQAKAMVVAAVSGLMKLA